MRKHTDEHIINRILFAATCEDSKTADEITRPYIINMDPVNGAKYVDLDSVGNNVLNLSCDGNSKTGPAYAFNLSPYHSCDHTCECYKSGLCYACHGCYQFGSNMKKYAENFNYYRTHSIEETAAEIIRQVLQHGENVLFRWFTSGDVPDYRFIELMILVAECLPYIKFWSYTKKYSFFNRYVRDHGNSIENALPENLKIIYSHWMNADGSFFPMENPYNFPTSEFIPVGHDEMISESTHICPCSDPSVFKTCATCDKPCYTLAPGESMALKEHSTAATKSRDKEIMAAKKDVRKATKDAELKEYTRTARQQARDAVAELKERLRAMAA